MMNKRLTKLLIFLAGAISLMFAFTNCAKSTTADPASNPAGGALPAPTTPATVNVDVDAVTSAGTVSEFLFGVNLNWNMLGQGIIDYNDLLLDRSFRLQAGASKRWNTFPSATGSTTYNAGVGDASPTGGNASNGYFTLSQTAAADYNCIDQVLLMGIPAGVTYQLDFSSYGVGSSPALVAFLADGGRLPISSVTDYLATANGSWTRHSVTLTSTSAADVGIFRLCQFTNGTVNVDEVRLARSGAEPQIKSVVKTKLLSLGVKSLRWPGGTTADTFDWKKSIGSRISRAEVADDFGIWETPALGLHEFLNLCEELGVIPLVQINVLGTATDAEELLEYILGSAGTPQGSIRATNGRALPWNVSYFEIGNEPATSYVDATNYASLAKPIINAMKAKATALGKTIYLSGVSEAAFQQAEWLAVVPMLQNWNADVFAAGTGIKTDVQATHGHFYSYFGYSAVAATLFKNVMSAGETLRATINDIKTASGSLPFVLTEFGVIIHDTDNVIKTDYMKDYQAGLVSGLIYQTMMQEKAAGAHFFNFSEDSFGMTRDRSNFYYRPTAHAFNLYSVAAGNTLLNSTMTGNSSITIATGAGNIANNTSYSNVTSVATKGSDGIYHVFASNNSFTEDTTFGIKLSGVTPSAATVYYYKHTSVSANNESDINNVIITSENVVLTSPLVITLPKHSMIRVDLR